MENNITLNLAEYLELHDSKMKLDGIKNAIEIGVPEEFVARMITGKTSAITDNSRKIIKSQQEEIEALYEMNDNLKKELETYKRPSTLVFTVPEEEVLKDDAGLDPKPEEVVFEEIEEVEEAEEPEENPKGRKSSLDVDKIITLKKANWSNDKVADEMGVSTMTVSKYWCKWKEENGYDRNTRSSFD